MDKREINEKLFLVICKVIIENSNKSWVTPTIDQVKLVSHLDVRYIHEFIRIMNSKELLKTIDENGTIFISVTEKACAKIREINAKKK